MFAAFGPDPDMQLYGRGLRRRLPTMLGGDQRWIRMAYSLMFALPGAPTLFYGEEIGMGENLAVEDRLAVRTPMQWTGGAGGRVLHGAAPTALVPPAARRRAVRARRRSTSRDQRTDPDSLLNWFERLIRLRKEAPEIGWGTLHGARRRPSSVLALRHDWGGRTLLTVHNLGRRGRRVELDLHGSETRRAPRPPAPRRTGAGARRPGHAHPGGP